MAGQTEDGTPIIRNPATRPMMELLDNVLALARFMPVLCFICCDFTNKFEKFYIKTSGYATWFTPGGAIRIAHYDVIDDIITRKL